MHFPNIGHTVIWLNEVDSTNNYASRFLKERGSHGTVVAAKYQHEGKGQRGNSWESEPNENMLCSIVLWPTFLEVQEQFLLSKVAALAVRDVIADYLDEVTIKWPNDVYVGNSKIGGILIENSFSSTYLDTSIVGVGVNINQMQFPDDLPNPTSIARECGKNFDIKRILDQLCGIMDEKYRKLIADDSEGISLEYLEALYRKDQYYNYKAKGKEFRARIAGVRDSGELVLETENGEKHSFAFKEVAYVL